MLINRAKLIIFCGTFVNSKHLSFKTYVNLILINGKNWHIFNFSVQISSNLMPKEKSREL